MSVFPIRQQQHLCCHAGPVELVGNSDKFTYGSIESDSKPTPFKRIMRFYEVHNLALYSMNVTDIFEGYCMTFQFPGRQNYDYHTEHGVPFMVHKSLGTAKQWMEYSDMWDMKNVWRVIDQANGITVGAIYAKAVEPRFTSISTRGGLTPPSTPLLTTH